MVVDLVINHLSTVITWEDTGQEYFGRAVQNLAAVFYADDGLPTSPQPDRLNEALEVIMGLFCTVGQWTNVDKTVLVVCQLDTYGPAKLTYHDNRIIHVGPQA